MRLILFSIATILTLRAQSVETWPFDAKEAARRQDASAKSNGLPKQTSLDLGDGISLQLVLIPAGKFMMGSPESETSTWPTPGARRTNESPLHQVTITRPFYMSVYKITQEQYQQIAGTNPSQFPGK